MTRVVSEYSDHAAPLSGLLTPTNRLLELVPRPG